MATASSGICILLLLQAVSSICIASSSFSPSSHASDVQNIWADRGGAKDGNGFVALRRSIAEAQASHHVDNNGSFILAAKRTSRKDPLNHFKLYHGGWNISDQHYWASVGFTAVPLFVFAAIWFVLFGLALLLMCCCCCCCCCPRRKYYSYSSVSYSMSLLFLILFTIAVAVGCLVLYLGQDRFHKSTTRTLDYVVGQANYTADNLKNLSDALAAAKTVKVAQFILPLDVQAKIDGIQNKLNASSGELSIRANENADHIQNVLDFVLELIVIAAVMLLLAFLGFLLSVSGLQFLVAILVLVGWILVTGTFVSSGVFLLLHNVFADTCVAMDEWVQHPHAHTALDDILPCLDIATANETLYKTREVTFQIVDVVNNVIGNFTNRDFPPSMAPLYYNQSGPLAPLLCNPFLPNLDNRSCSSDEVTYSNAPQIWKTFVCSASGRPAAEMCTTVGRFTPGVYRQLIAATNVSFGLYHYGPFLADLVDCTFVRETFTGISANECPGLGQNSKLVYVGLSLVSVAVMLLLIFWVVYARERRHRKHNIGNSGEMPLACAAASSSSAASIN